MGVWEFCSSEHLPLQKQLEVHTAHYTGAIKKRPLSSQTLRFFSEASP